MISPWKNVVSEGCSFNSPSVVGVVGVIKGEKEGDIREVLDEEVAAELAALLVDILEEDLDVVAVALALLVPDEAGALVEEAAGDAALRLATGQRRVDGAPGQLHAWSHDVIWCLVWFHSGIP